MRKSDKLLNRMQKNKPFVTPVLGKHFFFFFFLIIATCWGPPLLGFVEAVVPGDADVVLEGSESDSSGSISDPEAEVAPAVRCPPLWNCLERYNGQGNWTGI